MPDSRSPLQDSCSQFGPWTIHVARDGRLVSDLEPRIVSDRGVEVVPRSVADDLAERLQTILDMPSPFGRLGDLLGDAQRIASEGVSEYRAAYPREETP